MKKKRTIKPPPFVDLTCESCGSAYTRRRPSRPGAHFCGEPCRAIWFSRTHATDPVARFWKKIHKRAPDDCWEWQDAVSDGYGRYYAGRERGRVFAHRYAYELLVGPIPRGMQLDHLCRNRACVNPDHLRVCSHTENMFAPGAQTITAKLKAQTHCKRGHEFTPDNIYRTKGGRSCVACRRLPPGGKAA